MLRRAEGIGDSVRAHSHDRLVRAVLAGSPSLTAQALRPAAALPAALGGRHATGSYGLAAPVPAVVISRPSLTGAEPGSGVARVASVVRP
jgi:hypothetical protein